jgi:hypothetical protein
VKQDFWFGLAGFGFRGSVMRERQQAYPVRQGQPVNRDMRHSAIPTPTGPPSERAAPLASRGQSFPAMKYKLGPILAAYGICLIA